MKGRVTEEFAARFAAEWIAAWNSHDLTRILSHYSEDFEFSSPFIASVAGEPSGRLRGKAAVGAYWQKALARRPDLHFSLVSVASGVDSLVIIYQRHDQRQGAEVFEFDAAGLVCRAAAHY
ncbi:MAG: hypothetical protein RLZZ385_345 [Pseudomonadota bacterium]|jgi:hypothetical protein